MARSAATDLDAVQRIVLESLASHRVQVFLFGSRADGRPVRGSDIDVAILPLEPLPAGLLTEISEALENSRVLYTVDLVDLTRVEPAFRERVEREGIRWR